MRIELEQAIDIILNSIQETEKKETIEIGALSGRVCAENVYASMDNPPFDRSPLDGYAFFHEDVKNASAEKPATLCVKEEILAGMFPKNKIERGTAARIMTGAPIPEGADCVIRQEDTNYGNEYVKIYKQIVAYENYCYKGEDIKKDSLIVTAGETMNFVHSGVLAGMGIDSVKVFQKPKVFILITGDELSYISSKNLELGKIYESNSFLLKGRLFELGVSDVKVSCCGDSIESISQNINENIEWADIVITTGGVSVGKRDMLNLTIDNMGAEILFHGVNLKPGSPALYALYQNKPIFCLSGNPFAATVTFELLVRPAIAKISRDPRINSRIIECIMADEFNKKSPMRRFIRAVERNGKIYMQKGLHSSGVISSMRSCNCLIDIEAGNKGLSAGEKIKVILL